MSKKTCSYACLDSRVPCLVCLIINCFILYLLSYTVRVFDDSDLLEGHNKSTYPLFMSKTHKGLSSGSSELFGPDAAESNQTRENWRVQFKCSNFIFPCNDMRFSFVLLSCGCPRGQIVSKSCNASFMAWQKYEGSGYYWTSASDAVCVDGPPTSAPTFMPIAMTLTLRPSALSREVQSGVKKGWKPSFPLFLYTLLVAITAINN